MFIYPPWYAVGDEDSYDRSITWRNLDGWEILPLDRKILSKFYLITKILNWIPILRSLKMNKQKSSKNKYKNHHDLGVKRIREMLNSGGFKNFATFG